MKKQLASLATQYLRRTERSRQCMRDGGLVTLPMGQPSGALARVLPPLLVGRAEGSRIWDLDGHDHVDVTMGFGVHFLGHGSKLLSDAVQSTLAAGLSAGLVGRSYVDAARRIRTACDLPVVHFGTTGTEAVMTAIRIARARTGRRLVARFEGHYHGHADVVLERRSGEQMVLPFGGDEALAELERRGSELAAVVASPISALAPSTCPITFLAEVGALARKVGAAFVVDEVLTGFRFGPRPLAVELGLRPDVLVLGKVLGGGHPIGILATTEAWMGEGSDARGVQMVHPRCLVAGTFNRSALATAACDAMLAAIDRGEVDYARLAEATSRFSAALSEVVAARRLGRVSARGALIAVAFDTPHLADLATLHLAVEGVYARAVNGSTLVMFLSTAHLDADLDRVLEAMRTVPGHDGADPT